MATFRSVAGLVAALCLLAFQSIIPSAAQSKADYERIRDDILAWQADPANQALCGTDPGGKLQAALQDYDSCTSANFRIVNGCGVTDPSPMGWNCAVLTKTKLECTGTLLTPNHVAVAAKCMEGLSSVSDVQVLINNTAIEHHYGEYPEGSPDLFHARAFGDHPFFNGATFENNMGVIELEKPVPIGTYGIRPACLPKEAANLQTLRGCVMTSFGMTHAPPQEAGHTTRLVLGRFDLTQHEICEAVYPPYLRARQLCATGTRAGSSSHMCVGDFGAGLLCEIGSKWTMVGMSSYTASDCKGPAAFNDMWSGFTEKNSSKPAENSTPAPTNATTIETTTAVPTTNATTTEFTTTTEAATTSTTTTEATTVSTTTEAPTTTPKAITTAGNTGGQGVEVPNVFIGIIQQYLKPFKQFAAIVG